MVATMPHHDELVGVVGPVVYPQKFARLVHLDVGQDVNLLTPVNACALGHHAGTLLRVVGFGKGEFVATDGAELMFDRFQVAFLFKMQVPERSRHVPQQVPSGVYKREFGLLG